MTPRVLTALVTIVIFTALLEAREEDYETPFTAPGSLFAILPSIVARRIISRFFGSIIIGKDVLWDLIYNYIDPCQILYKILSTIGGALVGKYLIVALLTAIGFGPAGIVAESFAAFIQTPFTAPGSLFSILQSIGARGIAGFYGKIIGGIGAVLWNLYYNNTWTCVW